MTVTIITGDCRVVLATMAENSVDAVVCDPPYELGFMGKAWDRSGVAFDPATWAAVLRVAKPGAYLLAFGGTRTCHRIASAIEDGGWEIRDRFRFECDPETKYGPLWDSLDERQRMALLELLNDQIDLGSELAWVYGSGFPKSKNGPWGGTALKPAHEPIVVARKPLIGTVAANVLKHGTGALNIDGCRVPHGEQIDGRWGNGTRPGGFGNVGADKGASEPCGKFSAAGRWPANVIHDGSEDVLAAFPEAPGQQARARTDGAQQGNHVLGALRHVTRNPEARDDAGSAARFFYCAKASASDREAGLEGFQRQPHGQVSETSGQHITPRDGYELPLRANTHPTVKPTDLMRYLCRLVTPEGGIVLDPFAGSGSTGRGAVLEGLRFVGIEMDVSYAAIALARIAHAEREYAEATRQSNLFGKTA